MSAGEPSPGPEGTDRHSVVVVGPGRVGQSLAAALADAGRPVTLTGRTPEPPGFVAGRAGIRYRPSAPGVADGPLNHAPVDAARNRDPADVARDHDPADAASHRDPAGSAADPGVGDAAAGRAVPGPRLRAGAASTLVLCVPDDVLPDVARSWAGGPPPARGDDPDGAPVALHTSGVHPSDALGPLREAGWSVAAWHPLTALAGPRPDAFRGVTFGLEGDARAVDRGRDLARRVGGRAIEVEDDAHARYHAAAVFASNFLVACLSTAARELGRATGDEGGVPDLLPLARAALENLGGGDLAAGATGPLTRGDVGTVRRHLEALSGEPAELYRRLARELLSVVEGRLTPREAEELRETLETDA